MAQPNTNNPNPNNNISITDFDERYWKNWPENCPYNDDLNWACSLGIKYLESVKPKLKKTGLVVFDLDDTLFMNDPDEVIGIEDMKLGIKNDQLIFIAPVNLQVVTLARKAKLLGFKIVIITSRPLESKIASLANLRMFDIPFDKIIMNNNNRKHCYKIDARKELESKEHTVVLTVGDQPFDCYMPGTAGVIKLPDPECKASYAYFP